jgi:protein-tyrosine phosphatase
MNDMMDLPRPIMLEGASNARDLGGWPAADGRRVRFGEVFRSASLGGLTEPDATTLGGIGLHSVVDLRSERERQRTPSRLDALPGVRVHFLPIDPSLGRSLHDIAALQDATGQDIMVLMRHAYVAYVLDWAHCYAILFDLLGQPANRPLLFHCTAGKDRTGVGAALVLAALGVPYEAIRADYLATNLLWQGGGEIAKLLPPVVADVLLRVHDELLDTAFATIRTMCGSVDAYLEERLGLNAARRGRLRDALLS